jgi:hypothetical protein
MGMGGGIAEAVRQRVPADEIDQIIAADRHHLRDAFGACIGHPVCARA